MAVRALTPFPGPDRTVAASARHPVPRSALTAALERRGTLCSVGYSHSWMYDTEHPDWSAGWSQLVDDASRLRDRATDLGILAEAEISEHHILVAGTGDDVCEELVLYRRDAPRFNPLRAVPPSAGGEEALPAFGFVKTAFLPYDALVTAVLLRASCRLGAAIEVCSDGCWDDWAVGRDLVAATFPSEPAPARPRRIRTGR